MHRLIRLSGLAAFLASLLVCAWWWMTRAGVPATFSGIKGVAADTALFSLFAVHHSVFARPWAKRLVERLVPADLVRTTYVWIASVLLAAVCLAWVPVGGVVFHAEGAAATALRLTQLLGVVIGVLAVRRTSIGELSGAWDGGPVRLEANGIYGVVRHPLYTSVLMLLVATPEMTGDRALFAGAALVFVVAAIPFEEAGLGRLFGERYAMYRRAVRWRLIPYIH